MAHKKTIWIPGRKRFANTKAFNAAHHPFFFQQFLWIRFFDIEVCFFGTAILKLRGYSLLLLDVKDIWLLFKTNCYYSLSIYLFSRWYSLYKKNYNKKYIEMENLKSHKILLRTKKEKQYVILSKKLYISILYNIWKKE